MEIKGVQYPAEDGSVSGSVEIIPSAEGGVFVSGHSDGLRVVGESATISGIFNRNHLEELEAGNKTILSRYVVVDLSGEGKYKLVGCNGFIETSETSGSTANGAIQEFAPLESPIVSAMLDPVPTRI